jgi:hypothetical protein
MARMVLNTRGEVAEWLMAPVLKTGIPERVSGVRIPPSPPVLWSSVQVRSSAPTYLFEKASLQIHKYVCQRRH